MQNIRSRIVAGVAATCIIPLLFIMYLMSCWYMQELQNPATIVVLTIMAVLIFIGGLAILKSIPAITGAPGNSPPAPTPPPVPAPAPEPKKG